MQDFSCADAFQFSFSCPSLLFICYFALSESTLLLILPGKKWKPSPTVYFRCCCSVCSFSSSFWHFFTTPQSHIECGALIQTHTDHFITTIPQPCLCGFSKTLKFSKPLCFPDSNLVHKLNWIWKLVSLHKIKANYYQTTVKILYSVAESDIFHFFLCPSNGP